MGTLPSEGQDKFKHKDLQYVIKTIEKNNERLKKFGHVNKKALEQFKAFSEQKEKLNERKTEIDDAEVSMQGLISHLDLKKEEAIAGTFKSVAKHFKEVFHEIVPQGAATLKMIRSNVIDYENNPQNK